MKLPKLPVMTMFAALCAPLGCDEAPDLDRACRDLQPGHACTWVGSRSEEGFNGDGHRREILINQPQDLLFLPDGTAWFTDFNNFLIRRIHPDGAVETMVGSLDPLFPGDGPFEGVPPGGAEGLRWMLNHPTNLVLQPDGSVLVVAWHNHKLLTVDPANGFVKVVCGGGAGFAGDGLPAAAGSTLFRQVNDATVDEAGNVYILDQQNERIRKIAADGIITTIAGDGTLGYSGDGGPALEAQFSWAQGSNPNPSGGLVYHQDKLYVSDTEADVIRVIDLVDGTIHAFAGTGEPGDSGDDGPALAARLNGPRDLEIGPDGDLYFADTDNGKVRAIDLEAGIIRTVVGTGELGVDDEDGLPATRTRLRRPFGVAFDPDGNLYVMDTLNSRIVKVAQ